MGQFRTTMWTQIAEAQLGGSQQSTLFVERYRAPLLSYLRRRGYQPDDCEDLAQEVFLRLFSQDLLARADRERGRFRSYLLGITNKVILKRAERAGAKKRGGGRAIVPLDDAPEPAVAPDEAFDDCWAEGLLQRALDKLAKENPRQHEVIRLRLQEDLSLEAIGQRTDRTAAQVKTDHHRAKKRLARLVKDEIRAYSGSDEEYADELSTFLHRLGGR
jgi:RNA polymerase sigma factor (sigma-70 family)